MTSNIQIYPGTENDLQFVYNLVKQLAVFEKEPDAVTATFEHYLESWHNKEFFTLIAKSNNEPLGMALYYLTFSTWKGRMLYLEDFFVLEEYRNLGIGSLLFKAFVDEAKNLGCALTKWQVLDWNENAIRFYEKNGATIEKGWWNGKLWV